MPLFKHKLTTPRATEPGSCPDDFVAVGSECYKIVENNCSSSEAAGMEVYTCPRGFVLFDKKCYFFEEKTTNWLGAVHRCLQLSSSLVKITSEEENKFVQANVKSWPSTWIGLSDIDEDGTFEWTDGSKLEASRLWPSGAEKWHKGMPDYNVGGTEHCIHMNHPHLDPKQAGTWNDKACRDLMSVACSKEAFKSALDSGKAVLRLVA